MRLPPDLRRHWLAGCATLLVQGMATPSLAATGDAPSDAAVAQAIEALQADPNLLKERQARRLRWRREAEPAPEMIPETDSAWMDLLTGIARLGRVLMWLLVAAVLVIIGITLMRYSSRWRRAAPVSSSLPTHVQNLDIRPEGLPDDVGAAALELWLRGERRACLALLYRGLLSRLVHVHAVPITASSTEGDCVRLARTHLPEAAQGYAAQLVRTWQHAVYGAREPDDAVVRELCAGFATALTAAAVTPSP